MSGATAADVRDWARRKGLEVGTRGHLPSGVVDQYNRAHRVKKFENTNPIARRES